MTNKFCVTGLTANGYQKQFDDDRDAGKEPVAPSIPQEIISK